MLVLAVQFFNYQPVRLGPNNSALFFVAVAVNLILVRFAHVANAERLSKGLLAISFAVFLLVFYFSKLSL